MKFCKFCGEQIPEDAVICTKCGRQVEEFKKSNEPQQIVINNSNANVNTNQNVVGVAGSPKSKLVSILLLVFLGFFGAHKFYEGKVGMGILYLCTGGLCGIGLIIDFIALLGKPSTYYV